ncbi:MAG: LTA synthase family protein [Lachnospiraceae bacterium]
MKMKVEITKTSLIYSGIMLLLSLGSHFLAGISLFNVTLFTVLFFAGTVLRIELTEKMNFLWTLLLFLASSVLSAYMVQYVLLVSDLRDIISPEKFFFNACLSLIVYLTMLFITNRVAVAAILANVALMFFAILDFFVYTFRGNEFTFGDISTALTGLSVASNYQFQLNAQIMNALLLLIVYIVWVKKIRIRFQRKWSMRAVCLAGSACMLFLVLNQTETTVTETWEQKGTYRNGYILNFALSVRDSFVEKPEGYSLEKVDLLEEEYSTIEDGIQEDEIQKPTVIVIMNESFTDFRVLGNLYTNKEVMPFIDSLSNNTIKGYALASVFGAKTPNSEWEFLTGNSMAWLPSGSVPYQQYVSEDNAYSLVSKLKEQGYTTVAMHPYYASGWSRNTVYPVLGFDEIQFLEDFDQTNLMREYVSDETMFSQIIDRYESRSAGEKLFLMGITMQNHGGYTQVYDNFSSDIRITNMMYEDVNQYLSLAHQTDLAVENLITYFENKEEPVIVCFFGDHQPSLNTNFYQRLNSKGLSGLSLDELEELYSVPFFIWTNYDSKEETEQITSLNYLSSMLMVQAGLELSPYQQFLADMRDVIPSMNARAYYSLQNGGYAYYSEATGEEAKWLEDYQILQYNGLFDDDASQIFFDGNDASEELIETEEK